MRSVPFRSLLPVFMVILLADRREGAMLSLSWPL
jgi:hypothetical protein